MKATTIMLLYVLGALAFFVPSLVQENPWWGWHVFGLFYSILGLVGLAVSLLMLWICRDEGEKE